MVEKAVVGTIYCGFLRDTEVEQVIILTDCFGAGITRCLECQGHKYLPALDPEEDGLVMCVPCKGQGIQYVSC